jgi:hypothetical protein
MEILKTVVTHLLVGTILTFIAKLIFVVSGPVGIEGRLSNLTVNDVPP